MLSLKRGKMQCDCTACGAFAYLRAKEFLARAVCTRECAHTVHTVSSPWKNMHDHDTPGVQDLFAMYKINLVIGRYYLKFF